MQPAGHLVRTLAEFAAGVKVGEDQLQGGYLVYGMLVHRNAPAVVLHGAGTVEMDRHPDRLRIAGQRLVYGIVDDLENAVVEPPFMGVPDVHVGPLSHTLQALEFLDF